MRGLQGHTSHSARTVAWRFSDFSCHQNGQTLVQGQTDGPTSRGSESGGMRWVGEISIPSAAAGPANTLGGPWLQGRRRFMRWWGEPSIPTPSLYSHDAFSVQSQLHVFFDSKAVNRLWPESLQAPLHSVIDIFS